MQCEAILKESSDINQKLYGIRSRWYKCQNDAILFIIIADDNSLHGFCKEHNAWWPLNYAYGEFYFPTAQEIEVAKILMG